MEAIEEHKPELKGILPQDEYYRLTRTDKTIPTQLLKNFSNIPRDATGDMFGQIYEYFLGNFALAEGQGGGEFFTPRSVVRLMVEIIEPHHGTVFDPACGSGGMFVQSAHFVEQRSNSKKADTSLFVYGQEKTLETVKLVKMNIAVISRLHKGNRESYVELVHRYFQDGFSRLKEHSSSLKDVSKRVTGFLSEHKVKSTPHFSPVIDSAKTLIGGFQKYEKIYSVDTIDKSNKEQIKLALKIKPFFENLHQLLKTVDKEVRHIEKNSGGSKDLKALKTELEELHREVKETEYFFTHINWLQDRFPDARYDDVTGLCKLATIDEVKEQDYSLNPGRYVGVVIEEDGKTEEEFIAEIVGLNDELETLNKDARSLEKIISKNIARIAGEE